MAEQSARIPDSRLRPIDRFITDHDAQGRTTFTKAVAERLPWQQTVPGVRFGLGYVTEQHPVNLTDNADIQAYQENLENPPGIVVPGGSVLRVVDMAPGMLSPMHRTISLDYGVVLEGEVELVLDSGETRLLKRGDISIQRGTNHAWRNASETEWARMLYVLQEAHPLQFNGKALGEDYGVGMGNVKPSGH